MSVRQFCLLLCLLCPPITWGQGGPPGGGGGYAYKITIVDTENGGKVRGLNYAPSAAPFTASYIAKHEATYSFTVTPLNGAPAPSNYQWSPGKPPQGLTIAEGVIAFNTGLNSHTCTGYAWSPGRKTVTCTITVEGVPNPIDVTTDVLVIGGPLKAVTSGSYILRDSYQLQSVQYVPSRDTGTNAWHLQIFAHAGETAIWEQTQQTMTLGWEMYPEDGQITYDWELPGYIEDPSHPEASQPGQVAVSSLWLWGTSPGGPGTVSCTMYASFTDLGGEVHTGSASDTTASVHGQADYSNKVTVHKPTTIEEGAGTLGNNTNGVIGAHSAKWHVLMVVKDQNGNGMPGVVVQERFPNAVPAGFRVNEFYYWTTRTAVTKQYKLWAPSMFTDSNQWTASSLSGVVGAFDAFDNLSYIWSSGDPLSATHQYWAGTSDTDLDANGVLLTPSNWVIVFASAGLGVRGSVTHGGNLHEPP